MVLGKLPVPGRPTYLDYSRARAYCACSRCGLGGLDILTLIYPFSSLSLFLGHGPIYTEIVSQRAAEPGETNHPSYSHKVRYAEIINKSRVEIYEIAVQTFTEKQISEGVSSNPTVGHKVFVSIYRHS